MTSAISFTPGFAMQIYAGLVVGGIALLTLWHWPKINACRAKTRFAALHSGIMEELERTETHLGLPMVAYEGGRLAKRAELALKLLNLGVNTPQAQDDLTWLNILPALAGYASVGQIKKARTMTKTFE